MLNPSSIYKYSSITSFLVSSHLLCSLKDVNWKTIFEFIYLIYKTIVFFDLFFRCKLRFFIAFLLHHCLLFLGYLILLSFLLKDFFRVLFYRFLARTQIVLPYRIFVQIYLSFLYSFIFFLLPHINHLCSYFEVFNHC